MDNLPDNMGQQLRDMANAGGFMQPAAPSHTSEMGVAGKVMTDSMLRNSLQRPNGRAPRPTQRLRPVSRSLRAWSPIA
jgi:hypothetical protein